MTIDVHQLPLWIPNRQCAACELRQRCAGPVPGIGPMSARVMFVGEAPGHKEDEGGMPFMGPAGAEFDRQLSRIGISRDDVWVTNLCKCRPSGSGNVRDVPPTPDQGTFCAGQWLDNEVAMIQPDVIVTMGVPATQYVTQRKITMEEEHGRVQREHRYTQDPNITVISIYHPAATLRNRGKLLIKVVERDFDQVKAVINGTYCEVTDEWAGKEEYRRVSADEVYVALTAYPPKILAVDTEAKKDGINPLTVQISEVPGSGVVVDADELALHDGLKSILSNSTLVMHNATYDLRMLWRMGINPHHFHDTMIMAWLLQDLPHGLKMLAWQLCGMEMQEYNEIIKPARNAEICMQAEVIANALPPDDRMGKRLRRLIADAPKGNDIVARWKDIDESNNSVLGPVPTVDLSHSTIDPNDALWYSARDPDATLRVYNILNSRIDDMGMRSIYNTEIAALPMVARMMAHGMAINPNVFLGLQTIFDHKRRKIGTECVELAGVPFNPSSDDQKAKVVFGGIKSVKTGEVLKAKSVTKVKGRPKVDAEALEPLRNDHPLIPMLLEYGRYDTLLSSFAIPVLRLSEDDGSGVRRVYGNINAAGTETGRYKHSNPNLAAMPVKYEEGRMIRAGFIAPPGKTLLAWDYSQIEMRGMAVESGDLNMIRIFQDHRDIHAETAAKIWDVPLHVIMDHNAANPYSERYIAKRGGFGTIYWISAHGFKDYLEKEAGGGFEDWDVQRCQQFLDDYFKLYPRVREYGMEKQAEARRYGYTRDRWGRIRILPQIRSTNRWIRAEGEREAVNSGIQSLAMGIVKAGMGAVEEMFNNSDVYRMGWAVPIMQIHDEVIDEVDEDKVEWIAMMGKSVMENATPDDNPFPVPIEVEAKAGKNWRDMAKLKV